MNKIKSEKGEYLTGPELDTKFWFRMTKDALTAISGVKVVAIVN